MNRMSIEPDTNRYDLILSFFSAIWNSRVVRAIRWAKWIMSYA
ncbi:MAG: hypothetical protein ACI9KK_002767 [Ascidiaceihabitans sp.]|jgi:hypothetical protein